MVKLNDMIKLIMFINPEGLNTALHLKEVYNRLLFIKLRAREVKYWVPTRPKTFYIWKLFGWTYLHPKLPSFDSGNKVRRGQPQFLSRWTPNMLNYKEYYEKDLFFINKSFCGENSTWIFHYRSLHTDQEKSKYIQENYFNSEFLYYNSVKYGKHCQEFIMPPQNIHLRERREIYLNSTYLQQQQFYKREMKEFQENLFQNKDYKNFMAVDWLIWYDTYLQKTRDASFHYGYEILTPRHWCTETFKGNKYPINLQADADNRKLQANQFKIGRAHV